MLREEKPGKPGSWRLDILKCGDVSPLSLGATRRAHPKRPRAAALQGAGLSAQQSDVSSSFRVDKQRSAWFRQRGSHNHWRRRNRTAGWLQKRPIFRFPRKRESRRSWGAYWIPAFAGMTETRAVRLLETSCQPIQRQGSNATANRHWERSPYGLTNIESRPLTPAGCLPVE